MKKLITTLLFLAIAPDILAIDMEYYTPNGLPTTGEAFKRMTLIFSDSTFRNTFIGVIILSAILGLLNGLVVKPLTSGMNATDGMGWFKVFIVGTVIYLGGFVPKATIHIYDPVKNDTQSVAGVPQIIVLVAGLTNLVERNMVDITNTASAYPYDKNANGINLKLFLNAIDKGNKINKKHFLNKDIAEYYSKCGKLNMALPGNTTVEELYNGMESPYSVMSQWTHPVVTVNIHQGTSGLTNMSCTDAWDNYFKTALNPSKFEKETEETCSKSGFVITQIAQYQACKSLLQQAYDLHGLSQSSAQTYIREAFIASSILRKINSDNPDEATTALLGKQLVLQGIGATTAASETQPQLRAVMTAIILGLIPFLTLFIVTPMWSKALKFITGALLWLTTWGVMMAVAHAGVMDSAMAVAADLQAGKMGLDSFMLAETDGIKMMAMFGKMQTNAMMMATAIAVAVFGFGSYAMTGLAQNMSGNMGQMGEKATEQTMTPQGRKSIRDAQTSGMASDGGVALQNSMVNQDTKSFTNTGSDHQTQNAGAGEMSSIGKASAMSATAEHHNTTVGGLAKTTGETNQLTSDARSIATKQTQNIIGDNNQVAGAEKVEAANQGQSEGQVVRSQNIANATGQDINNPQTLRDIGKNLANNNDGYGMTGDELKQSAFFGKLSEPQQQMVNEMPNTDFVVNPNFTSNGEAGDKIGISAGKSVDASVRQDESSTINKSNTFDSSDNTNNATTYKDGNYFEHRNVSNIRDENRGGKDEDFTEVKRSGKQVSNSDSWDDGAAKDLMQNNQDSKNFEGFEKTFKDSKNNIADKTDDNIALRSNINDSFTYGFKDMSVGESENQSSSTSNKTSGSFGVPKVLGVGISNETSHTIDKTDQEQKQADMTRASINKIYDESDTASEYLSKVNNFYNQQREEAQEILKGSDLDGTKEGLTDSKTLTKRGYR
jgi:hypothetical protein